MTIRLRACLLSVCLFGIALGGLDASVGWTPIALSPYVLVGGEEAVAVLNRSSELWSVRRSAARAELIAKSFLVGQPIDLATGSSIAFVTGLRRSTSGSVGEIAAVSLRQKGTASTRALVPGAAFGGIAIDSKGGRVYVAETIKREIRTMALAPDKAGPIFWTGMPGLEPGTIAFDNPLDPRRLFVAAPAEGVVNAIDLMTRVSSRLAGDFGDIRAMTVDGAGNRLMIADATCRCVWSLSLTRSSLKATPKQLLRGQLRQPMGLAWTSAGLWVADAGVGVVFLVDATAGVSLSSSPNSLSVRARTYALTLVAADGSAKDVARCRHEASRTLPVIPRDERGLILGTSEFPGWQPHIFDV